MGEERERERERVECTQTRTNANTRGTHAHTGVFEERCEPGRELPGPERCADVCVRMHVRVYACIQIPSIVRTHIHAYIFMHTSYTHACLYSHVCIPSDAATRA